MNPFCRNIVLNIAEQAEKPFYVDAAYWYSARGTAILCGYNNNTGQLVITAKNLVPLGVYTAWFITDHGPYPSAPKNSTFTEDGFDPNRLIVNSKGQLQYYVAHLDYNPFIGIPSDNKVHRIKSIILALHPDNTTHGLKPGPVIDHLEGFIN
jgi:hypothetical protein